MKIGIFLPNWIGDVVMATPTLRALRGYFGKDAAIVGMIKPYVADVLEGTTWLDECWYYDQHASDPTITSLAVTRRLGVGGRVTFCGAKDDPVPYYAAADVYVHPTSYDPCSLPVVTSGFNGAAELMTSGE